MFYYVQLLSKLFMTHIVNTKLNSLASEINIQVFKLVISL